jgi:hypothetical protein
MILDIPLEIPSQNTIGGGRTWKINAAKTAKRRALWRTWCALEMRRAGVPRATGPRSIHVLAYRTQRCKDDANLRGGAKACIDGCVDAGLLLDDDDRLARITYEQSTAGKSPTKKPHTIITITEGIP